MIDHPTWTSPMRKDTTGQKPTNNSNPLAAPPMMPRASLARYGPMPLAATIARRCHDRRAWAISLRRSLPVPGLSMMLTTATVLLTGGPPAGRRETHAHAEARARNATSERGSLLDDDPGAGPKFDQPTSGPKWALKAGVWKMSCLFCAESGRGIVSGPRHRLRGQTRQENKEMSSKSERPCSGAKSTDRASAGHGRPPDRHTVQSHPHTQKADSGNHLRYAGGGSFHNEAAQIDKMHAGVFSRLGESPAPGNQKAG